jgi:hypothetical protein
MIAVLYLPPRLLRLTLVQWLEREAECRLVGVADHKRDSYQAEVARTYFKARSFRRRPS